MNDDVRYFFLHWSNEITALITGSIFNTLKMAVASTLPIPAVKKLIIQRYGLKLKISNNDTTG